MLRDYLGREAEAKLGIKETSHKQALAAKVEVSLSLLAAHAASLSTPR